MRHSTNYKHVCGYIRDLQADLGLEADLMGIHSRQTTGLCYSFLIHQLIMKMSVHSHNSRMFSEVQTPDVLESSTGGVQHAKQEISSLQPFNLSVFYTKNKYKVN